MAKTRQRMMQSRGSLPSPFYLLMIVPCLIVALWLLSPSAAQAQENTPTPSAPTNVTADQVNEIARELWCPLCSGVRLDNCELKACAQMKEMIALKLSQGEDLDSIRNYFVAQYGPQVLGEPPWEGFNWLAWVLPFVVLAVGGYFLWNTVRRLVRPTAVAVSPGPAPKSDTEPEDEYERKLAEELKRYG